jgi:uncharacterized membrane protein YsdA (DUF1294 family)/cold shock CspA family protein
MRYQGKITKWNDEKGFGFVLCNDEKKETFVHISAFNDRPARLQISQLISYEIIKDASGREKAANASFVKANRPTSTRSEPHGFSYSFLAFMLLVTVFVVERTVNGFLPVEYLFVFLMANLIAFLYYYMDKTAALKGAWRKSEDSLHLLSLIGGWSGAYIAQKLFRHKTKKASFQWVYKLTVLIHCTAIVMIAVPNLSELL